MSETERGSWVLRMRCVLEWEVSTSGVGWGCVIRKVNVFEGVFWVNVSEKHLKVLRISLDCHRILEPFDLCLCYIADVAVSSIYLDCRNVFAVSASGRLGIFGAEVFLKVTEKRSPMFLGKVTWLVVLAVGGHRGQGGCTCLSLGGAEVAREGDFVVLEEVTLSLAAVVYRNRSCLGHLDRDLALSHRAPFAEYCPQFDRAASPALYGVVLLLQLSLLRSTELGQPAIQWLKYDKLPFLGSIPTFSLRVVL